ncbi:mechanosensitive ion channel family protein [Vibrio sp. RE86]|uniref:mechanosensitive ion channel family protein n=1 Tax=Vibrio sp. RE86 TaxID=2607605 RepID=UPI0020A40464|nr:mechanosensitive ion channel domain-containing protein [Vibrio sp. RE86]
MSRLPNVMKALFLFAFISFSIVANAKTLVEIQSGLNSNFTELAQAHESEQAFLEDVLRRKNERFRELLTEKLQDGSLSEGADALLLEQIELLRGLLSMSETAIDKLAKESRSASAEDKLHLDLKVQRRIAIMDTYYGQLEATLQQAEQRAIDVSSVRDEFKTALKTRVEFLSNAILYVDTQKRETEARLGYVSEAEKATLTQEVIRYSERIAMMVVSFESGIALMDSMGLDVTDYKQILLTITGDINADVLDIGVAYGLLEEWMISFKEWAFENTPSIVVKLALFLAILYLTRKLARIVSTAVGKSVKHSKMDFSVLMQEFFVSIASKAVIFVGLLVALSQVGIELGPLLTGFGVAGVIIGFALQDTLSNFASGLMILIYRPYDVGDMVKVAGIQGTVKNMSLVSTTVQTIDNQRLIIPNNKIWGDVINNITVETVRRVDMVFGIGYADDIDKAKTVFMDILTADERVLKSPEPMVKLHTLNESSVDFVVRPWVKTDDYWDVYWDVTERVKKRLDEEGITIPFPQRDVHIYNHSED